MKKPKFHWAVPTGACEMPYIHFDKSKMLSYLKNKNLLVIGDSLSEEFYTTVMSSLLSADECKVCSHQCRGDEIIEVYDINHNFVMNATSVRNDAFSYGNWFEYDTNPTRHHQHFHHSHRKLIDLDFYTPLVKNNISFIIFNTGAHYRPDDELLGNINNTLTFLFENHPYLSVVYRSTTAGHGKWTENLLSDPLTESPEVQDVYRWGKFHHQNKLVENLLRTHFPQVLHLDVYSMKLLRADMHCDALHYCLSGPINEWVIFLYNSLRLAHLK